MIKSIATGTGYDARSIRSNLKMVVWIMAWMVSLTVSDKAALHGWWTQEWITWLSIGLNVTIGVVVIVVFLALLRSMDDLQRKIQMDALAFAFGIGLVSCAAYMLLVTWGYIGDEEVSDIFFIMTVTYALATLIGTVRFR